MMKPDHRRIIRFQHRARAHHGRDHPAAINIAHQHHRHARRAGKAHVGNIAIAQVDFGGRSGPSTTTMSQAASSRAKLSSTSGSRLRRPRGNWRCPACRAPAHAPPVAMCDRPAV
jgi:hypothetical protein